MAPTEETAQARVRQRKKSSKKAQENETSEQSTCNTVKMGLSTLPVKSEEKSVYVSCLLLEVNTKNLHWAGSQGQITHLKQYNSKLDNTVPLLKINYWIVSNATLSLVEKEFELLKILNNDGTISVECIMGLDMNDPAGDRFSCTSDHVKDLNEWKKHMEGMKAEIVEDMSCHLRLLIDKAVTEAVQSYSMKNKTTASGVHQRHSGAVSERKKEFLHRASLLDDLMEVEHFRTIYHMFIAALCVFFISTAAVDLIDHGRLFLDFDLLFYTFGKLGIVVWSWICLFTYTLLVPYKALTFWGSLYPKSNHKILLSVFLGTFLLISQTCVLCVFPVYVVKRYHLPPASSFIVILEQIRFVMKSYSFLRETAPQILTTGTGKKETQLPQLSSYLYFLFCPTLLYRDSYPRTPYIRWKYVAKNFAQFLGCLFFGYFLLVTLCIPVFKNMSKEPFHTKTLVLSIFHATLPGTFVLLLSFFAFLHCWLNAFAEMLRFADRMFYKDWWNSTSFSNYYRTWNVVVHDWLYHYVYQDLLWLLNKRCRAVVTLAVFLISASVHEYVFTLSLGYFYPVMFCLFAIFGVVFNFMMNDKRTNPVWNVMVWTFLFIGQGIQLCLYCQEWYAQIHCPITEKTFWGLITPRSWYCRL